MDDSRRIWTVRAFEKASRRGRVYATRYHVIATSSEEAIRLVSAEHEHADLPETNGTRYTVAAYDEIVATVDAHTISAQTAEDSIRAGIA